MAAQPRRLPAPRILALRTQCVPAWACVPACACVPASVLFFTCVFLRADDPFRRCQAVLTGPVGAHDMSWCQIAVLKRHALRSLVRAPDGGFIVRSSQSNANQSVLHSGIPDQRPDVFSLRSSSPRKALTHTALC
jgi:hypothetical protein